MRFRIYSGFLTKRLTEVKFCDYNRENDLVIEKLMTEKSRHRRIQYREPRLVRGGSNRYAEWIQEGGEKG